MDREDRSHRMRSGTMSQQEGHLIYLLNNNNCELIKWSHDHYSLGGGGSSSFKETIWHKHET